MKIIVTGSRNWKNYNRNVICDVLDKIHYSTPITLLVHGAAKGADQIADDWASYNNVPVEPFPAEWSRLGKSAGTVRNIRMLNAHLDADLVIGFPLPGSIGTWHCINQANTRKMKVKVI